MMRTISLFAIGLVLTTGFILGDKIDFHNPVRSAAEDEVTQMPGLANGSIKFRHYSGYVEAEDQKPINRFWHYWFVESQSNPSKDPLVLWLNGGPGCSSLLGLLTELGPFRIANDGSVSQNKYAWNKRANVVFLESPAGVGFSYAVDGSVEADDDSTAKQNHLALKNFLRKFPQYKNSDLYLTGESYAGVYLPTLAARVDKDPDLNLKGVAIGNGYLNANKLAESLVYFSYYHGLVGKTTWKNLSKYCCDGKPPARGQCKFLDTNRSQECSRAVGDATDAIINSGVNPYNLYDKCYGNDNTERLLSGKLESLTREHVDKSLLLSAFNSTTQSSNPKSGLRGLKAERFNDFRTKFQVIKDVREDPPCTDNSVAVSWLNKQEVQQALHIPTGLKPFSTCADIDYTMIYPGRPDGLAPQIRQLISSPRKPTLLVYNGDVDLMCNFFGDEWFVDDLNQKVVQDYTVWRTNNQVSGFVKYFDRITFMTVKGSGHMVPTDKPAEALNMFEMFLDGMKPIGVQ
uniref:Carboxypeptidase n=1 Tax=Aceria tosichella TaxID=561515 RepID=A0A6G1SMQ2_9ACAR